MAVVRPGKLQSAFQSLVFIDPDEGVDRSVLLHVESREAEASWRCASTTTHTRTSSVGVARKDSLGWSQRGLWS